jgi:hypothetical protein
MVLSCLSRYQWLIFHPHEGRRLSFSELRENILGTGHGFYGVQPLGHPPRVLTASSLLVLGVIAAPTCATKLI